MSSSFQNLFDKQSKEYSLYRPQYPRELFDFLAAVVNENELVWDAGTGSGQAALVLCQHFERVYATDSSEAQIARAQPHPKITYRVAAAENSELADSCCDLITVANAVHWFDIEAFFEEVKRTLKPRGVIAVWCYSAIIPPDHLKAAIESFYSLIEPFWPAPVNLVRNKYRDLVFPFEEIAAPEITIAEPWELKRLLGFYSSWSAVQLFKTQEGVDPLARLADHISALNCHDSFIDIRLPLHIRAGRRIDSTRTIVPLQ